MIKIDMEKEIEVEGALKNHQISMKLSKDEKERIYFLYFLLNQFLLSYD